MTRQNKIRGLFMSCMFLFCMMTLLFGQTEANKSTLLLQQTATKSSNDAGTQFSAIISPNFGLWFPLGDEGNVYKKSYKYSFRLMFRATGRILIELGYAHSSLNVQDDYIKDIYPSYQGEEITSVSNASGGSVNQFCGGIRWLIPTKSRSLPYLRIGGSNYKRGNITGSFSGRGPYYTFTGNIEMENNESGFCLFAGPGVMLFIDRKLYLDLQLSANKLFLNDTKPMWLEPMIGVNIFL